MAGTPLHIGITGGIGAGKSIVSRIFITLGIPVYDADTRARWLMSHEPSLKTSIKALFGEDAYQDGELNRQLLSKIAFSDPDKLGQLNDLVHPAVGEDYRKWALAQQDKPYTLKEAALLFESGSFKNLDKIILVSAPEALRIQRVLARDPHRDESDVRKIISRQWPEKKKLELVDFVITNDGSKLVIPQVLDIHRRLLEEAGR